jgi:hypothetical protein
MKKAAFFTVLLAAITMVSCGGDGAYTETEKKDQDKGDSIRQEDKFKDLEKAEEKQGDQKNMKVDAVQTPGDPNQQRKVEVNPGKNTLETEAK